MTTDEIYAHYRIMPNLQLHQLRVAAVARMIGTLRNAEIDLLVRAGLLHDMGNILKADLSLFPTEFYGDRDRTYWEAVKESFGTYGRNEHEATLSIVRELNQPERVIGLIEGMGFSKAKDILETGSLELRILEYADQRVSPYGVTSMRERLEEGRARYMRVHAPVLNNDAVFETSFQACVDLEKLLFRDLALSPSDINEESIQPAIQELRGYQLA